MNLNKLMSQVDAYDDARQVELEREQEKADAAYDLAEEAAMRELTFDELLEELHHLPNPIKEAALKAAAQGKATPLLADAYAQFLEKKTGHLLSRATYYAQQLNDYNETLNHFYWPLPDVPSTSL